MSVDPMNGNEETCSFSCFNVAFVAPPDDISARRRCGLREYGQMTKTDNQFAFYQARPRQHKGKRKEKRERKKLITEKKDRGRILRDLLQDLGMWLSKTATEKDKMDLGRHCILSYQCAFE